jgi:hypothetical protein
VQNIDCAAFEGEGKKWIAARGWMTSTKQEAKGSLEISALTSARFLSKPRRKEVSSMLGFIVIKYKFVIVEIFIRQAWKTSY